MRKPISWFPYTWRPVTVEDRIERNLAIAAFNLVIVIVLMLIALVGRLR